MTVALGNNIALPLSSALSYRLAFDTMGKLANYGKLGGTADPDAVIKALFAAGEQGAWYDPSDFSTMFQDGAGTTPVTAVGQSVGLILDKSNGLVLGSEMITNGDFASGTTGWSNSGGTFTPNGGALDVVGGNSWFWRVDGPAIEQYAWYEFRIDISNYVSGSMSTYLQGVVPQISGISGNGSKKIYIYVSGTTAGEFRGIVFNAFNGTIDNLSYKKISGNHAIQATSASRPVLANNAQTKQYRNFDAVDDSMGTTFASSLGSSCTVARSDPTTGASILTAQTIGTSYSASADDCALIIVNRAITTQETTDVTAWLNAKAGI